FWFGSFLSVAEPSGLESVGWITPQAYPRVLMGLRATPKQRVENASRFSTLRCLRRKLRLVQAKAHGFLDHSHDVLARQFEQLVRVGEHEVDRLQDIDAVWRAHGLQRIEALLLRLGRQAVECFLRRGKDAAAIDAPTFW